MQRADARLRPGSLARLESRRQSPFLLVVIYLIHLRGAESG